MSFDWKSLVRNVAPTIGTVLSGGNPLVGMGIKAVSNALLGKPDGTEEEISTALQNADPDTLLKLKEADHSFKTEMAKIGLDEKRLAFDDADSARKREMEVKDATPAVLAYVVTALFGGVLIALFKYAIPEANKATIYTMVGALGTVWITAMAYYHGSSRGSARKDMAIKELKK